MPDTRRVLSGIRGQAARGARLLVLCCASAAARPGAVQFSNGDRARGDITLTAGSALRLHDGTALHAFGLEQVREIRAAPRKESMERAWRFAEAGRTRKEFMGEPYPVRYLETTLVLADGTEMRGHLYTVPLYVRTDESTDKIVLLAKQRGRPGQTMEEMPYAVRVTFNDDNVPLSGAVRVRVSGCGDPASAEVAALTVPGLSRLDARRAEGDAFLLPPLLNERVFLGVRTEDGVTVGWPGDDDEQTMLLVSGALRDAADFFDKRRLVGTWRDASGDSIYSLLVLGRAGPTTLPGERTQPWRVGVWRWRDTGDGKLMLCGRGYLFRGLVRPFHDPPPVRRSPAIWQTDLRNDATVNVGPRDAVPKEP